MSIVMKDGKPAMTEKGDLVRFPLGGAIPKDFWRPGSLGELDAMSWREFREKPLSEQYFLLALGYKVKDNQEKIKTTVMKARNSAKEELIRLVQLEFADGKKISDSIIELVRTYDLKSEGMELIWEKLTTKKE